MQQEHTLEEIDHRDGCAGLVVGRQVRQLVVGTESLTGMAGTHATRQVILAADDVLIDGVDGFDVVLVASQCCHVGHAGVHVACADGMAPGLCLLRDGLVALRVDVVALGLATVIEQELGLVEVFLLTRDDIQACQCHLCDLVTRHHAGLTILGAYLADDAVGIALGDIKELCRTRSLVVGAGGIHHVTEVVELVAEYLLHLPALLAAPLVRMLGVDGAGGIEVAVGLLRGTHYVEHRVDISFQLLIWIGLEHVACTLDGLIDIGIVEREAHELCHVPLWCLQTLMTWVLQRVGCHLEVLVAVLALAFREGQRDSHLAGSLDAVPPEGVRRDLHGGERNLGIGIPVAVLCLELA